MCKFIGHTISSDSGRIGLNFGSSLHQHLNPLLHRLFLDPHINFLFLDTLKKFKLSFESIENGAFAPKEQLLHFP